MSMFSYYGSKSKIVNYYPPPKYGKIIEPFAGSARYALKYFDRDVLLVDKYEVVIKIWKWLQQCSKDDILKLPKLEQGLDLRTLNLSEQELLFLGMLAGTASFSPRFKVSPFSAEKNERQNEYKIIANHLHKIKHWEIRLGCYQDLPNKEATWFVDPPYQFGGKAYVKNKIDFTSLSEWCRERNGQTIVCENTKADWLPFKPVTKTQGAGNTNTVEAIWSNHKTNYDNIQQSLFK
jgi:site-specific DNA-adenine methylase